MVRSWYFLLMFCITYGQTKLIKKHETDELDMDEGYLTISNINYSTAVLLKYNQVVCEHCDFEKLGSPVPQNSNRTFVISTRYPYDFQLYSENDENPICQINSHKFSEHGGYLFEIMTTNQNKTVCSIIQIKEPGYYVLPIVIVILILCTFIFLIQVYRRIDKARLINRITRLRHHHHHEILVDEETGVTSVVAPVINSQENLNGSSSLPTESTPKPNVSSKPSKAMPKRLQALDTFRGFALMVMIFVNYGGGGYWFFDHSTWNGLTLADLVFPWFTWMIGVSIVLSQRSLLKKKVSKRSILLKICRRTAILFLLGLILQGGSGRPENLRILGVLQRLALCYFFTALIVLALDAKENEGEPSRWPTDDGIQPAARIDLSKTIFQFWFQWMCIIFIVTSWLLITFVPKLTDCPRGYIGPGGKHEHGKYTNCTGGVAGYLDRTILGSSHIYGSPTCKDIYETKIPYDPEGLLGTLTGIFLCYLGVHAAHCFIYSTRVRHVCIQWVVSGLICGFFGLLLSKGGHSESWIPINKNLWSLTFIFVLSSLAFFNLTILYLLVDVYKVFTGEPWLWLGMNSIVIYCGHDICGGRFPVQFDVDNTHTKQIAMNFYGSMFWAIVAGILYYNKIFIAI